MKMFILSEQVDCHKAFEAFQELSLQIRNQSSLVQNGKVPLSEEEIKVFADSTENVLRDLSRLRNTLLVNMKEMNEEELEKWKTN